MEEQQTAKKQFSRVGFCYFALMLLTGIFQFGAALLLWRLLSESAWGIWVLSYVPLYGMAVPVFLWMMKRLVPDSPNLYGTQTLSFPRWVLWFLLSIGAMYLLSYTTSYLIQYLELIKGSAIEDPLETMQERSSPWIMAFVSVIIAPIAEEYLFRKLVADKLSCYGERTCIFTSGFLFALFHANWSQLLYAFVLGAMFCYIYLHTGKLWYTISLHMAVNFFGSVAAPYLTRTEDHARLFWVAMFFLFIIGQYVVGFGRLKFPPESREDDEDDEDDEDPDDSVIIPSAPRRPSFPLYKALLTPGMIAYTALSAILTLSAMFLR